MKTLVYAGVLCTLLIFSCKNSVSDSDTEIDYGSITDIQYNIHIQPLLNDYAEQLKAADIYLQDLDVSSWDNLFKGWKNGAAVIPYDPQGSLLYQLTGMLTDTSNGDAVKRDVFRRWIEEGASNTDGTIPFASSTDIVYVCNQGASSVSLIDVQNLVVMRTIHLDEYGFSDHAKPHDIAVEPDGSAWYVSLIADGKVVKFDAQNRVVGTVDTPTPGLMTLHPDRSVLYVGRSMTAPSPPSSILAVNTETMTYSEIPVPFARPHALAVQPGGDYLVTASLVENKIAVVDARFDEVDGTYAFPADNPVYVQFAFTPAGTSFFGTGQLSGKLYQFDLSNDGVAALTDSTILGEQPWHPLVTPDGSFLYTGNKISNTVSVFDIDTHNVIATLQDEGIASPHGSAMTEDGSYIFISNQNNNGDYQPPYRANAASVGTVTVINNATHEVIKTIEIGATPSGMGHK